MKRKNYNIRIPLELYLDIKFLEFGSFGDEGHLRDFFNL